MADLLCSNLSGRPVTDNLDEWLSTAKALLAAGEYLRAKLVLSTVLQAHPGCVWAHVQLVHTHLHLEQSLWPKALHIARHGLQACSSSESASPTDIAECQLALGLALACMARMQVMPQLARSDYRSEARVMLSAAADQSGSHVVHSLYALALVNAEGGHYQEAVQQAQQALHAAEASGQEHASKVAPIIALVALLLSARQQLQDALKVVQAGLNKLPPSDCCDAGVSTAGPTSSIKGSTSMLALPRLHDVLLLRIQAQLLVAQSEGNKAVLVLGTAVRRVTAARHALTSQPSLAAGPAAELLRQQEAQLWLDLALLYASQQQPEDANKCVQQLRLLDPDSAATFHVLGAVAASQKNDVAAKANYKAALARDAAYAPALLSLGALLRRQGDVHDLSVADGLLTAALRNEPDSHMGWFHLGLAREAQGHITAGEQHLFTAMELASAAPVVSCSKLPLLI